MIDELLHIENLSIGYGKPVCSSINAIVRKGDLVGLAGKNGSGKSTLIRSILGLQDTLLGSVKFLNEDMKNWDLKKRSQRIAVVFSRLDNVPAVTVFDLVALGRLPYSNGFSKLNQQEMALVEDSLEKVGVSHLKDQFATQLSDGQLQMVMIARALAQDTDLILMDEPTSHLDIENQFKIFELIYKLSIQTQKTFIVASHQVELLFQNSNQLWWIDDGKFHSGFPEQVAYEQQIFEKLSQKRIRFDYQSGSFKFQHHQTKMIDLIAEDDDFGYWTKRALERNGFGFSKEADLKIELKSNRIFVNKLNFETVDLLIEYLKNHLNE